MDFTEEQLERYSRQIILSEVGGKGQALIRQAKVLVIGAGGLGSPAIYYLVAAGIGTIGIADFDKVGLSNLQRQILHFTKDLNRPKTESAAEKIHDLNPDVKIETYKKQIDSNNIVDIIKHYDFIIDGTDNFSAKFLINDACVLNKKPFSHGGVLRFEGQTMTYLPGHTCYRCIFIKPPEKGVVPGCREAGVLGAVVSVIGSIQATEALKYILGQGELLTDKLLSYNSMEMNFSKIKISKNNKCPVCGENPLIKKLINYEQTVCKI